MQTSKNPPNFYRVCKIKELSRDWEYVHYTDQDILGFFLDNPHNQFPDLIRGFNNLAIPQHKADYFRYYYLYMRGGVYMDTDLMPEVNVEDIVKDYEFISVTNGPSKAFNGFIGAVPCHDILYLAFQHIYDLSLMVSHIRYDVICHAFGNIIRKFNDPRINMDLTENIDRVSGRSRIKNSKGELMMTHYFDPKSFYVSFFTKNT